MPVAFTAMGYSSSLRSFRAKVRRSFAHRGLWGTLAYVPEFATYLVRSLDPQRRRCTQFELPNTLHIAYFYNPFSEVVLAAILQKIQASLAAQPRDLWVCYTHPYAHAPLDQADFLRLVQAHAHYRIYRAV